CVSSSSRNANKTWTQPACRCSTSLRSTATAAAAAAACRALASTSLTSCNGTGPRSTKQFSSSLSVKPTQESLMIMLDGAPIMEFSENSNVYWLAQTPRLTLRQVQK